MERTRLTAEGTVRRVAAFADGTVLAGCLAVGRLRGQLTEEDRDLLGLEVHDTPGEPGP
jgi:hypothetical protein